MHNRQCWEVGQLAGKMLEYNLENLNVTKKRVFYLFVAVFHDRFKAKESSRTGKGSLLLANITALGKLFMPPQYSENSLNKDGIFYQRHLTFHAFAILMGLFDFTTLINMHIKPSINLRFYYYPELAAGNRHFQLANISE